MSDVPVPCKKFSTALQDVVQDLLDKSINKSIHPIPQEIIDFKKGIIRLLESRKVDFSYGIMGSTSESLRYISDDHYEFHLKLELPFEITPIRDEVRQGFVQLQVDEQAKHPSIVNGYVDRGAINKWLNSILRFHYAGCVVSEQFFKAQSMGPSRCCLTCLPVLEFDYSKWPNLPNLGVPEATLKSGPWYAIPTPTLPFDSRSFQTWSPDWERFVREAHPHYSKIELLMLELFSGRGITFPQPKQVVQTVIMHAMVKQTMPSDLGESLVIAMESFIGHLEEDSLHPLLTKKINLFRCVTEATLEYYHGVAVDVVSELKRWRSEALAEEQGGNGTGDWKRSLKCVFRT